MLGLWRVFRAGSSARWEWFQEKAKTQHARVWLGSYSFFESLILPFPTDVFLALMVYADRARVVSLTILTTATSVVGAAVGYFLAYFFYETVAHPIALQLGIGADVVQISETLNHYAFLATFLGAFTPIPYTPVIIAAGFLKADFFAFLIASIIGRGLRYALVSGVTLIFGVAVLPKIGRSATLATIGLFAVVALGFIMFIFLR